MRAFIPLLAILLTVGTAAALTVPAADQARDHSPVITENGDIVHVQFIHYDARGGAGRPKAGSCFKTLGVKWTTPVSVVLNPTNTQGLSSSFVTSTITTSLEAWDAATSRELVNAPTLDSTATPGVFDGKNVIGFGSLSSGTIGVTNLWYSRATKRVLESDITFNQAVYAFGDAIIDPVKMDLQEIATHEAGHFIASLNDIYSTSCTSVTMYGYSDFGETHKRTLEPPDIAGLQKNYGA